MTQRIEVDKQLIYIKQKKTAWIVDADKLASHHILNLQKNTSILDT